MPSHILAMPPQCDLSNHNGKPDIQRDRYNIYLHVLWWWQLYANTFITQITVNISNSLSKMTEEGSRNPSRYSEMCCDTGHLGHHPWRHRTQALPSPRAWASPTTLPGSGWSCWSLWFQEWDRHPFPDGEPRLVRAAKTCILSLRPSHWHAQIWVRSSPGSLAETLVDSERKTGLNQELSEWMYHEQ